MGPHRREEEGNRCPDLISMLSHKVTFLGSLVLQPPTFPGPETAVTPGRLFTLFRVLPSTHPLTGDMRYDTLKKHWHWKESACLQNFSALSLLRTHRETRPCTGPGVNIALRGTRNADRPRPAAHRCRSGTVVLLLRAAPPPHSARCSPAACYCVSSSEKYPFKSFAH